MGLTPSGSITRVWPVPGFFRDLAEHRAARHTCLRRGLQCRWGRRALESAVPQNTEQPATARDLPCPKPNSNRNHGTSLIFRQHNSTTTVTGIISPLGRKVISLLPFPPQRCSPSDRNAVRDHNEMMFGITPKSRSPSSGFPNRYLQNNTSRFTR
jgi:hypothetical protein